MKKRLKSRFIFSNRWIDRHQIVRNMDAFQDLIVIFLCVGLFGIMVIQLWDMFGSLLHRVDFRQVTSEILFLLILVELFRLLVAYLQEHSVSVGVAEEVTIVSVLREVIVHGVLEISWTQLLATCGLLFILGALLMVCARTPHMDYLNDANHHDATHEPEKAQQHERERQHSSEYDEI